MNLIKNDMDNIHLSETYQSIKSKMQHFLMDVAKFYGIESAVSLKNNYEVSDLYLYELYRSNKKRDGSAYKFGEEYTPLTWNEWLEDNFPDFYVVQNIYSDMISTKIINSDALQTINMLYNRYI